ncbi:MAG TPA: Gfo/Idh/MocA family oxidoreductase [candidate division Zixibacteria bacterium]|nr:Gfo/Idh/MocA family oxidoreductase [candidate division Zixibacteria bacterium]
MKKTKIGVIGTGHLGRFHSKILSTLDIADLVGVYDIDSEKANAVGDEFGCRVIKDMDELLDACEAVVIASTTATHKDIALRAFDADCHVLVEKPIAESSEDGGLMVSRAETAGKVLMVGHVEHFNPAFGTAQRLLEKPSFVEGHRLTIYRGRGADVSVVHDLLIHDLELLLAVLDEEVVGLSASGSSVLTDSPDIANVRLEFTGGCVANITASRVSLSNMRKMRFFQQGAYIGVDFGGKVEVATLEGKGLTPPESAERFELPGGEIIARWFEEVPQGNALQIELEHFIDCINTEVEPLVSGKRGLEALRLADRIVAQIEGR